MNDYLTNKMTERLNISAEEPDLLSPGSLSLEGDDPSAAEFESQNTDDLLPTE
jgi:hypothetical protein